MRFCKGVLLRKYPGAELFKGPVRMTILVYMPIPKSTSKKKRKAMLVGKIRPTKNLIGIMLARLLPMR